MKLLFIKKLGALRPVDTAGEGALQKLGEGKIVSVEMKQIRNPNHHRLFMALLQIVFNNQDRYDSFDHLRTAITIAVGHCYTVVLPDGSIGVTPRSISFAAMDQGDFNIFFDNVVGIVCQRWLPTVTSEELRREINEMIGIAA